MNILILDHVEGDGFQSTIFTCMGKQYKRYATLEKIELFRFYFTGNNDCVKVDHQGETDEVLAAYDKYVKEYNEPVFKSMSRNWRIMEQPLRITHIRFSHD